MSRNVFANLPNRTTARHYPKTKIGNNVSGDFQVSRRAAIVQFLTPGKAFRESCLVVFLEPSAAEFEGAIFRCDLEAASRRDAAT